MYVNHLMGLVYLMIYLLHSIPEKQTLSLVRVVRVKQYLLKSIIGLHDIDSGEILYDDREFTSLNFKEKKEIRKEIGMLFQGSALFDSSTVEENVRFPLDLFTEMTPEEKLERANFCLERVNIINKNHLYPAELSGGMKKSVAIARAIASQSKISVL